MGQGIAQLCAQKGFKTILLDINPIMLTKAETFIAQSLQKAVEKGKLTPAQKEQTHQNIRFTSDIKQLTADLIIEAVTENLAVKQGILSELAALNATTTILASNTSSIPITRLAAHIPHPERFIGLHFFNPAFVMPLVEVIPGARTAPAVVDAVFALAQQLGKSPVRTQDSPGFIVNRVARPFYVESLKILEENIADVATIDALLRATGFKMGPFELMDLIGVDVNFSVTCSLHEAFFQDPKFRPSRIQQQKVDAGYLGRKSGQGFYDYT
jgi:3-hydroxybutyryl-CoA dehydrogenase